MSRIVAGPGDPRVSQRSRGRRREDASRLPRAQLLHASTRRLEGAPSPPPDGSKQLRLESKQFRLEEYLPCRLSVAANAVSQLIARAYEDRFGRKVPQWRVIAVLADEGPLTPLALCERTVMDKVTVTRAAQALVERRLVKREPHATDGRSRLLRLTEAGERLHAEIAPLAPEYERQLLAGMDEGKTERSKRRLRRLQEAADALERGR